MKRQQQGISLIGFVIVLALLGFAAYLGMRVFPMYQEFYSVKAAARGLADQSGAGDLDAARLEDLFFRRLDIDYARNVTPENVSFKRIDGGWDMHIEYEVRRPLIANLDVVGHFDTTQQIK